MNYAEYFTDVADVKVTDVKVADIKVSMQDYITNIFQQNRSDLIINTLEKIWIDNKQNIEFINGLNILDYGENTKKVNNIKMELRANYNNLLKITNLVWDTIIQKNHYKIIFMVL